MGHKAIKEHYDIGHIVAIHDKQEFGGPCICIGSPYIHDIIVIRVADAKVVKRYKNGEYSDGWNTNEDLKRYDLAIFADQETGKLRELIDAPDTFERSLPVFTIRNWAVVRDFCEEYGWPNTTHTGKIMYENTYFKTRKEAYAYLLQATNSGVRYCNFKANVKEGLKRIKTTTAYSVCRVWDWIAARTFGRFILK